MEDFIKELNSFGFDDIYICPHESSEGCKCRKPNTQLLESAAIKNNLTLKNCVVIGDRWSDMLAAAKVGAIKILVLTGAGKDVMGSCREKWSEYEPEHVAENLLEAIMWLNQEKYI